MGLTINAVLIIAINTRFLFQTVVFSGCDIVCSCRRILISEKNSASIFKIKDGGSKWRCADLEADIGVSERDVASNFRFKNGDSLWRCGVLLADTDAFEEYNASFFKIENSDMVAACGTV